MNIIRLILTVLILAVVAVASDKYEPIDTTNFANRADAYQGRLVAVSGSVVAVNADLVAQVDESVVIASDL